MGTSPLRQPRLPPMRASSPVRRLDGGRRHRDSSPASPCSPAACAPRPCPICTAAAAPSALRSRSRSASSPLVGGDAGRGVRLVATRPPNADKLERRVRLRRMSNSLEDCDPLEVLAPRVCRPRGLAGVRIMPDDVAALAEDERISSSARAAIARPSSILRTDARSAASVAATISPR